MKLLIVLVVLMNSLFSTCQIMNNDEIDEGELNEWREDVLYFYSGTYSFGFSEGESTLRFFADGDTVWAQIVSFSWNSDATAWVPAYRNLNNVRVEKGKFYSDESNGVFIHYKGNKCLQIDKPWSEGIDDGLYELGKKNELEKLKLEGKYQEVSTSILTEKNIEKLDKSTLQLMRNEVFARYGHQFKKGGKMDTYFSKQSWYQAYHKDATKFLTAIEKRNVKLIQSLEAKK